MILEENKSKLFKKFLINSFYIINKIYDLKEAAKLDIQVPDYVYAPSVFKIFANHILPMQTPGYY